MLMRSLMARSMRTRPMRYWFSINSPTARTRRLPRWSMSSTEPRPFLSSMRWRTVSRMSCGVSTVRSIDGGSSSGAQAPVDLEDRVLLRLHLVGEERVAEVAPDVEAVDEEDAEGVDLRVAEA